MTIDVELNFGLERFSPVGQKVFTLEVAPAGTVQNVVTNLNLPAEWMLVVVNERVATLETELSPGDRLKLFPWLAGG